MYNVNSAVLFFWWHGGITEGVRHGASLTSTAGKIIVCRFIVID